jgi:addiction module RelE/StbE family toxin
VNLRYTLRALRHLDAIASYIGKQNPQAARAIGARIRESIDLLAKFPNMGHQGALPGTREMVVPSLPYIVVHRIETRADDTLVILGIYHGAQLRPGQPRPPDEP